MLVSIVRHDGDVLSAFHYLHFFMCDMERIFLSANWFIFISQTCVAMKRFQATGPFACAEMDSHNVDQ